ncbi:unannotated protein [freshwater metagenome]|uniref:Unannotated protein n=1 Tax=freshwater metagenome TaxID=449393 RepID=A0A6J6SVH0_9ZZZZ|nr:hypothetical protein [Actinomycetota bacterium]
MRTTVKLGLGTIAGAVGAGLLAFPAAQAADSDVFWKRDDDRADVVSTVDDDDDDDTNRTNDDTNTQNGDTNGTNNTAGDTSGVASNDNTNSRVTDISRDRDISQGDRTRDWTRDGGDETRDTTANATNDKSRNDTRR